MDDLDQIFSRASERKSYVTDGFCSICDNAIHLDDDGEEVIHHFRNGDDDDVYVHYHKNCFVMHENMIRRLE